MVIRKIINNNIVSSLDEQNREILVMGRGIGFSAKAGSQIDVDKVDKVFRMETKEETNRLSELLKEVPLEHVKIANEIISYAKKIIKTALNPNIYITLTDHINFAIQRYRKNIMFKNQLLWEIKKFYPDEFVAGKYAIELIKERLKIDLEEDEAASVAMHFVNAELNSGKLEQTAEIMKIIQNAMTIVKYHYGIELNEDSLDYARFVTHMKFFAQRILNGERITNLDDKFCMLVEKQYPDDYKCANKIVDLIKKEYGYEVSDEEKMYLTMHIKRVVMRN